MAGESVPHSPTADGKIDRVEAATLLLRVWVPEADTVFRWDGAEPWMAMLRRAVELSGGTVSGSEASEGPVLAASFPARAAAMRAGRRLQALASGYADESKGQLFGVSILICPGAVSAAAAELRSFLQRSARRSQTLLALRGETAPPEGARIEEASVGGFVLYALAYPHAEEAGQTVGALLREQQNKQAIPAPALLTVPTSTAKTLVVNNFIAWTRARSRSVAAVLGASVAVFAGVAIARHPATHTVPVNSPVVHPPVVHPVDRSDTATQPPTVPAPVPVPKQPSPSAAPKSDHSKKQPPEAIDVADNPKRGRNSLTAEQIRQILVRGQNALDRGCYTEAMGYYRRVLNDDPRNGSATGGLAKARVSMGLSGDHAQCAR